MTGRGYGDRWWEEDRPADLEKTNAEAATKAASTSKDSYTKTIRMALVKNKKYRFWFTYKYEDPETKEILGYEAIYLGTLKLQRAATTDNEAHSFSVVSTKEEMGIGDRLITVPPTPILNYMPHAPAKQIAARIMSIYGGVTQAGQNQVVSVNRGKNDGLDIGSVLRLSRLGQIVQDRTDNAKPIKLPDEQYGSLFIFRVFNYTCRWIKAIIYIFINSLITVINIQGIFHPIIN